MVLNVKVKAALTAVVFGLSAHASNAATVSDCNPFAAGQSCYSDNFEAAGFGFGSSAKSALDKFRERSNRGFSQIAQRSERVSERSNAFAAISRAALPVVVAAQAGQDTNPVSFADNGDQTVLTEASNEGNGTESAVSVVPVPAAGALLLVGLGGLVALRRKKS